MPSIIHEFVVDMFRGCPALSRELLAGCCNLHLDPAFHLRLTAAEFAELTPPEYRADAVMRIEDGQGQCQEGWIIEVQLSCDEQKRISWPYYVVGARARLRRPVTLVVIALDQRVASWCAEPIVLDRAGNIYRPLVLGPAQIPAVTDIGQAMALPELAVLSAAAHGTLEVASAALGACSMLDEERATRYSEFIEACLNEETRLLLETLMSTSTYQMEVAKSYIQKGREEGRQQGHQQGRDEGLKEGRQAMLGKWLRARFGELPGEFAARLNAADSDELDRYAERLMHADTLDEVFAAQSTGDV